MSLVRTGILNGFSVAVRMGTGLLLNKILAVLVGPAGYAIMGQFQNVLQISNTVATGAINNGVTKYTAEFGDDDAFQRSLWRTAGTLVIATSLICSMLIIAFRRELAIGLLDSAAFSDVFIWLALGLTLFSMNTLLLAVLNGKKELGRFVTSNIAGSAVILLAVTILTLAGGLYGALIALAINQSLVLFVTLAICWRASWFRLSYFAGAVDWSHARRLMRFAAMAAVSAFSIAAAQIVVRSYLGDEFGWEAAGLWDAMARISSLNWTLVASTMAFYFLPRIAELKDWRMIRWEILSGSRLIMPLFVLGCLILYLLRSQVINLLFTAEFMPMEELFAWQLAGDAFRVATWFGSYVLIAKSRVWEYVITECVSNGLFVAFTFILVPDFGLRGAAMAHLASYVVVFVLMYSLMSYVFRRLVQPAGRAGSA